MKKIATHNKLFHADEITHWSTYVNGTTTPHIKAVAPADLFGHLARNHSDIL